MWDGSSGIVLAQEPSAIVPVLDSVISEHSSYMTAKIELALLRGTL
jgi:hypothetical protein